MGSYELDMFRIWDAIVTKERCGVAGFAEGR
jgi:hypothetical protein